jgi:hypothetical protein
MSTAASRTQKADDNESETDAERQRLQKEMEVQQQIEEWMISQGVSFAGMETSTSYNSREARRTNLKLKEIAQLYRKDTSVMDKRFMVERNRTSKVTMANGRIPDSAARKKLVG